MTDPITIDTPYNQEIQRFLQRLQSEPDDPSLIWSSHCYRVAETAVQVAIAAKGAESHTTPTNSGLNRAPKVGEPNSIYEQVGRYGKVRSRTFYDENRRPFEWQDFDHGSGEFEGKHRHEMGFDEQGRPIKKKRVSDISDGYTDDPSGR